MGESGPVRSGRLLRVLLDLLVEIQTLPLQVILAFLATILLPLLHMVLQALMSQTIGRTDADAVWEG